LQFRGNSHAESGNHPEAREKLREELEDTLGDGLQED
jgi:hypothetical protein